MTDPWKITRKLFLSEEETQRLLEFLAMSEREAGEDVLVAAATDRLIVETLLFTGLRNSEVCALRLADTVVGSGLSAIDVVDTPRQDRTIWVPHALSNLIQGYVDRFRPRLVPDGVDPQDLSQPLVFNDRGNAYERTALYRRVKRILTAAGFGSRSRVQLLRHTYGYLAYKRTGGNLLFTQRQLGHAHPMVTAVYAQFVDEDYEALAERVGGAGSQIRSTASKRKRARWKGTTK
jgi:integrase/recombinase XerD